jgi:DnaJ-class molecular chaperone
MKTITCPRCRGDGGQGPLWSDDFMLDCFMCGGVGQLPGDTCTRCWGAGEVDENASIPEMSVPCPDCAGTGKKKGS